MRHLTPFLLTICTLLSCQDPLEKQVVGNWVDANFVFHRRDFYTGNEWTDTGMVNLTFLDGGKLVTDPDTLDLIYEGDGYVYDAERFKTRNPRLRILNISDTTMKLVLFTLYNDTLNLKRNNAPHTNHEK